MLRIAYLISRYPALSHTFILREVRELRALGVEVHTASVNPPDRPHGLLGAEERQEAESTFVLKNLSPWKMIRDIAVFLLLHPWATFCGLALATRLGGWDLRAVLKRYCYLAEALLLGIWMERKQIGHLHVHFATPASTVALLLKEVFGIPFSMTVHGPDEFYQVDEFHLARKIEAADFICVIGSYCKSQLMRLSDPAHWGKIEITPLGVDPLAFQRTETAAQNKCFEILCVGRLVPAKGQAVLIEAFAALFHRGYKAQLTIAGEGPDRIRLEALAYRLGIQHLCQFLGGVNPERVRDLYQQADAFVLPSFAEGIPVVLMEAMAMKVPCVSTVITGIPELITNGLEGVLVPPSDVEALARAIESLIESPKRCEEFGLEGRRKVERSYNLVANVARLHCVFQQRIAEAA